jgi:phthalate 4,5-dioxygenase reductase component
MIITETDLVPMKVVARRALTPDISEFTLARADGSELPSYGPGAHITVRTPSGAMRRYSLVGGRPEVYTIAVKRERESRGGSASMHDDVQIGGELFVAPPENEFELRLAPDYLLIAGGIGVTPIYSMARHLKEQQRADFRVIYLSRSAGEAAYLEQMRREFGDHLLVHHDQGDPALIYDFWKEFETPRSAHVYCCGPKPLIEEIKAISGHWPEGRIHFEDFKPIETVRADDISFDVELAHAGMTVHVPQDRSILEAVREAGVRTVSSCESGTCGSCKTRLVAGEVDHRDMVLRDDEKRDKIMICVSRAKRGKLILDL